MQQWRGARWVWVGGLVGCVAPLPVERNLDQYAVFVQFLSIDSAGDIAPVSVDLGTGLRTHPRYTLLFFDDFPAFTQVCQITYEVASTSIDDGPFDVEVDGLLGQTWNAWQWTLTPVVDDCDDLATEADRVRMADLLPDETLYVAVGPYPGDPEALPLEAPQAVWSVWTGRNAPPAEGRFIEQGWTATAYAWDGGRTFDLETAVPLAGPPDLAPGVGVLRNVILSNDIIRWFGPF